MNKVLSAYLETGRVSNLPTVVSNVFLAWALTNVSSDLMVIVADLLFLSIAACLVYLGGCFLGDAKDVEFDKEFKPSRPIPSGILSRTTVYTAAIIMMLAGAVGFCVISGWNPLSLGVTGFFLSCVTLYALFHKTSPWVGLPFIGMCRGSLIAASLVVFQSSGSIAFTTYQWGAIVAVTIYTICFASVARTESSPKAFSAPNLLKALMLSLAIIPLAITLYHYDSYGNSLPYVGGALLIYIGWLLFAFSAIKKNKGVYVSRCLAGFALLDMVFISSSCFGNAAICFTLFVFAFILQRITPAT